MAVDDRDAPVGFAILCEMDQGAHIQELDVHPSHGRRGIGGALLRSVCRAMFARGYRTVTLCTYRDLPWTVPFYKREGFALLPESRFTPRLRQLVESERERGLRADLRTVMIREPRPT